MKKHLCFKTKVNSVVFPLILTLILLVLHVDFWNWGCKQRIFFGWMTQEFLYRIIFLLILSPFFSWLIVKFSWPERQNKEGEKDL